MEYCRMVVQGKVIYETETHYITSTATGTHKWSKAWYRLSHNL